MNEKYKLNMLFVLIIMSLVQNCSLEVIIT